LNNINPRRGSSVRLWATPRDLRLLDRLSLYPRLRDHVRASRKYNPNKPWDMAEGFQPLGSNDDERKAQSLRLPSKFFIPASSKDVDLFLLRSDCDSLKSTSVTVRNKSNKNTEIFKAPHVLITKGFKRIAFADFDVSFQHALRGIHGPAEHRNLLIFLAAYPRLLRNKTSRYTVCSETPSFSASAGDESEPRSMSARRFSSRSVIAKACS
jgi:hypothetical protein